jgi:hypothetical protein
MTNKAFGLLSIFFGCFVTYRTIKSGSGEDAKQTLIQKYRHLLNGSLAFLVFSNLLLMGCLGVVLYQALYFRNVEFIADRKIELYQSFPNGTYSKVGDIGGNDITLFRIRKGRNYFMYKEPLHDDFIAHPPVDIPFSWNVASIVRIKLTDHDKFESTL